MTAGAFQLVRSGQDRDLEGGMWGPMDKTVHLHGPCQTYPSATSSLKKWGLSLYRIPEACRLGVQRGRSPSLGLSETS